ncbi:exocyst complex component 4 [Hetaerina americana]|uniref:exocyst complex component 4 n=1 Tax=Hetaerina americana TaxID=62018 RepID=UPI003A7F2AF5
MALPGPPAKPPRGVKHPKETSGLLMSVIRTLSASESNEQRDREKAKLEKEYKKSDQRLDELISVHDEDLSQIMQLFGQLSNMVTSSREKVHAVKENLHACKMLLRCRRDELKKLWLEGVEHKHVLFLLEEIDKLIEVPNQLEKFVAKKHYLHATKLLVSAISTGEGTLQGVEALREVRAELKTKKEHLHQKLMGELSRHLYVQTSQEALNLRRQGSGRESGTQYTPLQRVGSGRARPGEQSQPKARRVLLDISYSSSPNQRNDLQSTGTGPGDEFNNIQEDIDEEDPEGRREHFMAILVECLAHLGKLPDAVEDIKGKMQNELLTIVKRTTQQVLVDHGVGSTVVATGGTTGPVISLPTQDQSASQGKALLDLLQTVFDQFRMIAAAHSCILQSFRRAAEKYRVDVQLYEMVDVWSKIQAVVQLLLTDYLDIQNTTNAQHQAPTSFSDTSTDISSYFARKKPQRQKRSSLFKFDYSSHALTMNSYLKEEKDDGLPGGEKQSQSFSQADPNLARQQRTLVCQPDPKNITQIFIPLMKFIEEIERGIGQPGPCTLSNFLSDYVKEVFLGQHHQLVSSLVDAATKAPDAWRTTTDSETTRSLGVSRPLLVSTIAVEKCILDLQNLTHSLPTYAEHFLGMMCSVLRNYRETCHAAYRSIVQPDSEDKRVFSAAWLKDEDISRFLKSLPNWTDLQAQKALQQQMVKHGHPVGSNEDAIKSGSRGPVDGVAGRIAGQGRSEEEESPEEVRQRNAREAEILAGNLGEGGINAHEIISDVNQLKVLAQLQESLEWFAGSISLFVAGLPGQSRPLQQTMPSPSSGAQNSDSFPPIPEATLKALQQQVRDFEDLADTCLLVLHLEVRVQCFHYLLPRSSGSSSGVFSGLDSQEPDPKVLELSRVLVSIDEAMSSSLKPRKSKYIFEGLGHLIAKVLIGSSQHLEHIDEMTIGKMCKNIFTLQQTLTNITMAREVALDYARRYYELFYQNPEEILSGVVDKGPQFSELEYMNALQLLNKSRGDSGDYGTINQQLERLSEILGEVGVTV